MSRKVVYFVLAVIAVLALLANPMIAWAEDPAYSWEELLGRYGQDTVVQIGKTSEDGLVAVSVGFDDYVIPNGTVGVNDNGALGHTLLSDLNGQTVKPALVPVENTQMLCLLGKGNMGFMPHILKPSDLENRIVGGDILNVCGVKYLRLDKQDSIVIAARFYLNGRQVYANNNAGYFHAEGDTVSLAEKPRDPYVDGQAVLLAKSVGYEAVGPDDACAWLRIQWHMQVKKNTDINGPKVQAVCGYMPFQLLYGVLKTQGSRTFQLGTSVAGPTVSLGPVANGMSYGKYEFTVGKECILHEVTGKEVTVTDATPNSRLPLVLRSDKRSMAATICAPYGSFVYIAPNGVIGRPGTYYDLAGDMNEVITFTAPSDK